MTNLSLSRDDLVTLRWAVQTAAQAATIQYQSGIYPKDVTNDIIRRLTAMEETLVEAIIEADKVPKPNSDPTLF